ncbi:hypothetical protein Mapa_006191 [Marchantia paleacea]|nr:hypothetical protein Mapa_006191 [Marchantia paleacea]
MLPDYYGLVEKCTLPIVGCPLCAEIGELQGAKRACSLPPWAQLASIIACCNHAVAATSRPGIMSRTSVLCYCICYLCHTAEVLPNWAPFRRLIRLLFHIPRSIHRSVTVELLMSLYISLKPACNINQLHFQLFCFLLRVRVDRLLFQFLRSFD